jgi:hypothetical protein
VREALLARFPALAAALAQSQQPSASLLQGLEELTAYRIHEEAAFEHDAAARFGEVQPMHRNILKMFFTLRDSHRLMEEAAWRSGRYDIVLRMRPDMLVSDACADAVRSPRDAGTVHVHHYHAMGLSDQFAFGGPEAMRAYMTVHDRIEAAGGFPAFEVGHGYGGESGVYDALLEAGLSCRLGYVAEYQLSSRMFPAPVFARLLLQDIPAEDAGLRAAREVLAGLAGPPAA